MSFRPLWAKIRNKPATFPPTLPIEQSDIAGLTTAITDLQNEDNEKVDIANYEIAVGIILESWSTALNLYSYATTSAVAAGYVALTGNQTIAGTKTFSSNVVTPNIALGYTTTATSAGTLTLTATSNNQQFFTGSTTHTVVLPVASTMVLGQRFIIENNSTGVVTVNSSGSNLVVAIVPNTSVKITCILASGTSAASWHAEYVGFNTVTGTGANVLAADATLTGTTSVAIIAASGQARFSDGTAAAPGIAFSSTSTQGFRRINSEAVGYGTNNTAMVFNSTNSSITVSSGGFFGISSGSAGSFGADTFLSRQAAGVYQIGTNGSNALGSLALTNLTASGTLRVGGGTIVQNILSATATLDFGSIAASSFQDLTITITGAVSGDSVTVNPIAGSATTDVVYTAWVSSSNTVTVRASNISSTTARDPASGTFRATVIRF